MMKKLFFAALVLIFALPAFAKQVDVETAKNVARTFWTQNLGKQARSPFSDVTSQTEFTKFYILNTGNGFVIVAADDIASPILGYSDAGNFDPQNIPVNMLGWLRGYENEINYGISNGITASAEIATNWEKLSNGQGIPQKRSRSVNALIQTKWDQDAPFNDLCPYDNDAQAHAVTGCVATAMAQVMKYWNYPTSGTGSHSYNHPTYGTLSADYGNTTYDWDNMLNVYTSSATQQQKDAVATLMYHCGVAVEMYYGIEESSAYVFWLEDNIINFFGYNPTTIQHLYRSNYSNTEWENILKAELDAGRPILYNGDNDDVENMSSHEFICDGYDANDYFHINWGWGGDCDGFFLIDDLAPGGGGIGGGMYDYRYNQTAIIGVQPNASYFESLVVTPENLYFGYEGGSLNFIVNANHNVSENWTAVSSAEWLTLSTTSGEGNGAITTVTATAEGNTGLADRMATITVTHGSETKTINVVSEGMHGYFYLNLTVNDTSLGYLPDFSGWYQTPSTYTYNYSYSFGNTGIENYNIAPQPNSNARFVKWNYQGDPTLVSQAILNDYITVEINAGYEPESDTVTIEAVFAPVHNGDTLLYETRRYATQTMPKPTDTTTYYRWGVKFDPSALGGVTQIPQVEAYLRSNGSDPCTYTIQLWQGGDDSPQNMLHTQTYTVNPRNLYGIMVETIDWMSIQLSAPVAIDSTQPLWVIFSCTTTRNPLYSNGDCRNPNGGYIWLPQTGWTHNQTLNRLGTWCIRAYSAIPTGRNVVTEVEYNNHFDTEANDCHIEGGGTYDVGTTVTLTAVPDSSHRFAGWRWRTNDYPYQYYDQQASGNPLTFTVNSNVTYTAIFDDYVVVSLGLNDAEYGSVHGNGYTWSSEIAIGSTTTITATPRNNGIFLHWYWYYDSNPSVVYYVNENPYTFRVEDDVTYIAEFGYAGDYTNVTVISDNEDYGSVSGGGYYWHGSTVTLTATPATGYSLDHWEWYYNANPTNVQQSTDNPVSFTANNDVTYTAYFREGTTVYVNVTALVNNNEGGTVSGGNTYNQGSSVTLRATPSSGYTFDHWEWHYDDSPSNVQQSTANPVTFSAERDVTYTAFFEATTTTAQITVRANNNAWGSVSGGGTYHSGETAVLRATPNNGYRFQYWMYAGYSGYTIEDNPFYMSITPEVSGSYTLIGYFAPLSGVDETDTDDIRIYSLDGCIIVEGADGETVTIYDMTGRIVHNCGLPNGVYMVKVGDRTPRKVVVAR